MAPPREPVSALSSTARRLASGPGSEGPSGREATRRRLGLPRVGRRVATIGLLVVLGVALLAAVPGLRGVLREIGDIGPGWVVLAVALELASSASFVVVFRLFFDSLEARDARALAWTTQASGVLLPGGGAGGLAIGGWLVHLTGAPVRWTARRSAALFFLGGAVSSAALVGAGLALIAGAPGPHGLLDRDPADGTRSARDAPDRRAAGNPAVMAARAALARVDWGRRARGRADDVSPAAELATVGRAGLPRV